MRLLIALLLAAGMGSPQSIIVVKKKVAGTAPTYLVNENMEGTGVPSGWVDINSPDWDYAAAPLAGAQSLQLDSSGASTESSTFAISAIGEVWGYALLKHSGAAYESPIYLRSGGTTILRVELRTGGALRVYHGATTATTVGTTAAGTTYHVWWYYKKGTGANGIASVAFSTDGTKPTSGNNYASTNTGAATADIDSLRVYNPSTAATIVYFDNIKLDDVEIGSNPL